MRRAICTIPTSFKSPLLELSSPFPFLRLLRRALKGVSGILYSRAPRLGGCDELTLVERKRSFRSIQNPQNPEPATTLEHIPHVSGVWQPRWLQAGSSLKCDSIG